ncbi:MAG: hypothetical protein Q8M22_11530 [Actinomycetota bacterium]|nr:hypothetical protein [Actinomycetota bacterium]
MDGHPELPDADAPLDPPALVPPAAFDAPPAFLPPTTEPPSTFEQPAAFEAPTAQFDGFAPPAAADAPISVVIHDEPKPRRTGLLVGLGALVVAAVGVGGFLLLSSDEAEATFSIDKAAAAAAEQRSMSFTLTVDAMGEESVIEAEIDNESGLARMTLQLGAMFDDGVEMIVDTKNEVVYVSSDLFDSIGLDVETDWIKMDEEFLADSGEDSMFSTATSNDAMQASVLLENATSVEEVGIEEIDGEQLKHYRVTVSGEEALQQSPQVAEQFESVGGEMPDEVTYDMWVSEDNELRRIGVDLDIGPAVITTLLVITGIDQPLDIELPDDDDTTDASELM